MPRLVAALAVLVLGIGRAWADVPTGAPMPAELSWLKVGGDIISSAGMPGVVAALLYVLKLQKEDRAAEVNELKAALREEQAYNRKVQDDRIAAASASADRLATVAVSSSNAITTAAEKNAGVLALCQDIKESVRPVDEELTRILASQDGLFGAINGVALKVGNGCRAP